MNCPAGSWLPASWGEFELLYAVDAADADGCARALAEQGLTAVRVGQLTAGQELVLFDESDSRRDLGDLLLRMRTIDPTGPLLADLRALVTGGR